MNICYITRDDPEVHGREVTSSKDPYMLLLIRIIHSFFAVLLMGCLGLVYYFGITGQRSPLILPAVIMLILEGLFLWRNKGLCPLEPLHRKHGDDKGFFGLFLPSGWLPHVIPFFILVTAIGFLLLIRTV